MPVKKTAARKASGTKTTASKSKTIATKARARTSATKKRASTKAATSTGTGKASTKKPRASAASPRTSGRSLTKTGQKSTGAMRARRGDLIFIDSPQVGSPAREGEVLKVIVGEVSVSYRVKWSAGHETLISPVAGTARIVRT